jgi:hypothetical protein
VANKIEIYRGRTYDMSYAHVDTEDVAQSLVGCTVYFTVKNNEYDTDATDAAALIKKTITDHDDDAGGLTSWQLDDTDTYITPGKYHFDVVVEDSDGRAFPPSLFGDFKVKGTPTNRNVGNET